MLRLSLMQGREGEPAWYPQLTHALRFSKTKCKFSSNLQQTGLKHSNMGRSLRKFLVLDESVPVTA